MKKLTRYWIFTLLLLCMAPGQSMAETIDMLVVYTPAALVKAERDDWLRGGRDAINARIDHMISETNTIFYNSQLDTRVRLVGRKEIDDYVESSDVKLELKRLQDYYYNYPSPFGDYLFLVIPNATTISDLPDAGAKQIIVALVDNNLHIRIFDKSNKMIADETASELTDLDAVAALRQRLDDYVDGNDSSISEWIAVATEAIRPTFLDDRMDIVHAWRNEVGADVVALVVATGNAEVGGSGSLPSTINHFDGSYGFMANNLSFTYVNFPYSIWYIGMLFAHELGHVLGCLHDYNNAGGIGIPATSNFREWGYGYKFWSGPILYGTIMATPTLAWSEVSLPILYFSNPDVSYWWVPMGSNDANNARLIRETAPLVEGYRDAVFPNDSIWVDVAYNGYAGTEIGTFSRPYITVAEGIYYVEEGGTIVFEQGSDNWTGVIDQSVTLTAGIGEMVIGQ